jgi:hypothetical protein
MPLPIERCKPKLAGYARLHTDPVTRRPLLLYPEGVLELEETTAAILSLCKNRALLKLQHDSWNVMKALLRRLPATSRNACTGWKQGD